MESKERSKKYSVDGLTDTVYFPDGTIKKMRAGKVIGVITLGKILVPSIGADISISETAGCYGR
jgi:hypothetical protein